MQTLSVNNITVNSDTVLKSPERFSSDTDLKPVIDFLQKWWDENDYIEFTTSGSTGQPKPIGISKASMLTSASITNDYFGLNKTSVALLCLPTQFIAGAMMVVRALERSYELLAVKPSGNPFSRETTKPIGFCACTPMQVAAALGNTTFEQRFESVETIIIGGAEIPAELEKKLKLLNNRIYATYGMTETITHIAVRAVNGKNKSNTFTVLPGFTIETDERNALVIEAAHLPGKIITNDLVEISGNQFKWIGRADNVINSGGFKFSPEELEKLIEGLFPYKYVISSMPDQILGNKLVLVLEAESLSETEKRHVINRVNTVLNGQKKIHDLRILGDFPVTDTGKIKRKEILTNLGQNKNT